MEKAFHGPAERAKALEGKTPPSSPFDVLCIGNTAQQCYWLCVRLCPLVYVPVGIWPIVYVPRNLGVCVILRLRCAFSNPEIAYQSRDCIRTLRNIEIAQPQLSRDCTTNYLEIAQCFLVYVYTCTCMYLIPRLTTGTLFVLVIFAIRCPRNRSTQRSNNAVSKQGEGAGRSHERRKLHWLPQMLVYHPALQGNRRPLINPRAMPLA